MKKLLIVGLLVTGIFACSKSNTNQTETAANTEAATETSAVSASTNAVNYTIDKTKGKVGFEIFKFKINSPVNGVFTNYSGTFAYDSESNVLNNINATIEAGSVNTEETKRDGHLKSADFFDVQNHPNMTFMTETPVKLEGGKATVPGKLTMRGVTKEVTLDVELVDAATNHFVAKTKIDRNDFGISWNKTFSLADISKNVLGDEVKIEIEIFGMK
jgi:polyisoprenoid-binding protein YceI